MGKGAILLFSVSAIALMAQPAKAQVPDSIGWKKTTTMQAFDYPNQFAPSSETITTSINTNQCPVRTGGDGAGRDPLIFDLDGDGVQLLDIDAGVRFDMDDDGVPDRTAWVGPDDAILVNDDGDGEITRHAEMFGSRVLGGISDLSRYDSNSDGVITTEDDIWGDLQLWQDKNTDGESRRREFLSLESAGVTSISLTGDMMAETRGDSTIIGRSHATGAAGVVAHIFDVIFGYVTGAMETIGETVSNIRDDLSA